MKVEIVMSQNMPHRKNVVSQVDVNGISIIVSESIRKPNEDEFESMYRLISNTTEATLKLGPEISENALKLLLTNSDMRKFLINASLLLEEFGK